MKSKKGCILSILLVLFIFGVTIPLFMTNHKKIKADTTTDLTNTTWTINQTFTTPNMLLFYLEGTITATQWNTDNNLSTSFYPDANNGIFNFVVGGYYDDLESDWFYQSGCLDLRVTNNTDEHRNWYSNQSNYNNLSITITGGDVTNANLISWLQNNATQQTPTPIWTQITNQYWAPSGVFYLNNNVVYSDSSIEYFILFNQYDSNLEDTEQIGLSFEGYNTIDLHSYIRSNSSYIYIGNSTSVTNIMLLEFNVGDYIDTDLYNFMTLIGYWFDEYEPYNLGIYQGYIEGHRIGLAEGQADGVQYTNLVTGIFNGLGDVLSIQVFPNITIALLIGLPLLLGAFIIIIKILRG